MFLFPMSWWADSVRESWAAEGVSGRRAVTTEPYEFSEWVASVAVSFLTLLPSPDHLQYPDACTGWWECWRGRCTFWAMIPWLHEQKAPLALKNHLAGVSSINPELLFFCVALLLYASEPATELISITWSLILCCRCLCIVLVWLWLSICNSQEQALGQLLPGVHFSQQRLANLRLQII